MFRLPVDAGVLVEVVGDGTPAARAGLKAGSTSTVVAGEGYTLGGDLIVAVAGKRVASLEELRDVLADHKPGETVKLEIYRGHRQQTLDVTLGRQPRSLGLGGLLERVDAVRLQLCFRRRVAAGNQRSLRVPRSTPAAPGSSARGSPLRPTRAP